MLLNGLEESRNGKVSPEDIKVFLQDYECTRAIETAGTEGQGQDSIPGRRSVPCNVRKRKEG